MKIKYSDYSAEEIIRSKGFGYEHSVVVTHKPTGASVIIKDTRSIHQARAKGIELLQAKLPDAYMTLLCKQLKEIL